MKFLIVNELQEQKTRNMLEELSFLQGNEKTEIILVDEIGIANGDYSPLEITALSRKEFDSHKDTYDRVILAFLYENGKINAKWPKKLQKYAKDQKVYAYTPSLGFVPFKSKELCFYMSWYSKGVAFFLRRYIIAPLVVLRIIFWHLLDHTDRLINKRKR